MCVCILILLMNCLKWINTSISFILCIFLNLIYKYTNYHFLGKYCLFSELSGAGWIEHEIDWPSVKRPQSTVKRDFLSTEFLRH